MKGADVLRLFEHDLGNRIFKSDLVNCNIARPKDRHLEEKWYILAGCLQVALHIYPQSVTITTIWYK